MSIVDFQWVAEPRLPASITCISLPQLTTQLEGLIGPAGHDLVTSILAATNPQGGTLATVIGLITLFIGATAVFGELQATLNLVWEVRPAPTTGVWAGIWAVLRERLFSLALVLALAFLLLVSLVISAALAGAAALLQGPEQAPPEPSVGAWRLTRGPDLRVCPAL